MAVYVENPRAFSLNDRLGAQADCCRALGRDDLDLLVLNQTRNLVLLDQVVRTGTVIWNRNQALLDAFELKTVHMALDFFHQRRREMGI